MQQSTVSGNERTVRSDIASAGHSDWDFAAQTDVMLGWNNLWVLSVIMQSQINYLLIRQRGIQNNFLHIIVK